MQCDKLGKLEQEKIKVGPTGTITPVPSSGSEDRKA